MRKLRLLIVLWLGCSLVFGQPIVPIYKLDSARRIKPQFIPVPAAYFSPETRLAVGCIGIYLFKSNAKARTSNIDFVVIYTLNKQLIIDPVYTIFTKDEKYFIKGNILFTKFPEFFYGIGNETSYDTREKLSYKTFRVYDRVLRKVRPGFFAGLQYQYFNTFDVKFSENSPHHPGSIPGDKGSITSGFGPSIVYDTRDNILNSTKGTYAELSVFSYDKIFGSQFQFTNYTVDLRQFKRITPNVVLAFQGLMNFNFGNVPFKQQATIGGSSIMRGYYNGRYRDQKLAAMQVEWRQHLYKRIGFTLFADIGEVSSTIKGFDIEDLKATAGGGLRFLLSRKENLNIRFDAGFGKDTHGFYVNISEAF